MLAFFLNLNREEWSGAEWAGREDGGNLESVVSQENSGATTCYLPPRFGY